MNLTNTRIDRTYPPLFGASRMGHSGPTSPTSRNLRDYMKHKIWGHISHPIIIIVMPTRYMIWSITEGSDFGVPL